MDAPAHRIVVQMKRERRLLHRFAPLNHSLFKRWPVLAFVWLVGCSTTATLDYSNVHIDTRSAIQAASLGPGDEFEVRAYEEPAMSGQFVVSQAGQIDYPLLGTTTVEGLTAAQVARLLREQLIQRRLIKNPSILVQVKTLSSKKVFVLGEVKTPGRFAFVDNMSIVEGVTLAGGFTQLAERNYAIVTRADTSGQRRIPVPVEKIMQGLAENFVLQPGDIVYIPETVM